MIQVKYINSFGRKEVYEQWLVLEEKPTRLYYIYSGSCSYMYNGKVATLEPGYLYLIPFTFPFLPYSDITNPLDHTYIDFEIIPPIISKEIYKLSPDASPLIKSTFELFLQIIGQDKDTLYFPRNLDKVTMDLLTSMVSFIVKQFVDIYNIQMPNDTVAISVMNELIDNIDRDITISEIAQKYYLSTDAIIRKFKKSFNTTPYAYLKDLRLRTATYLIQSGEKLHNVARATNYADASSLLHALTNKSPQPKNSNETDMLIK